MSSRGAKTKQRLTLTGAYRVRVDGGLDAVRLEARGYGLLLGTAGLRLVWGSLDVVLWRHFRTGARCRALFLGLHGVAWASIPLGRAGSVVVPPVHDVGTPALPAPLKLPNLSVSLTVTPPSVP